PGFFRPHSIRWQRSESSSFRFSLEPSQSCGRQFQVATRGPLRLLLERVEHVNGVGEARYIDQAICSTVPTDPDFRDTSAERRDRLPIAGITTPLDQVKLVAGLLARVFREITQTIERVSMERHPLERHELSISELI